MRVLDHVPGATMVPACVTTASRVPHAPSQRTVAPTPTAAPMGSATASLAGLAPTVTPRVRANACGFGDYVCVFLFGVGSYMHAVTSHLLFLSSFSRGVWVSRLSALATDVLLQWIVEETPPAAPLGFANAT